MEKLEKDLESKNGEEQFEYWDSLATGGFTEKSEVTPEDTVNVEHYNGKFKKFCKSND